MLARADGKISGKVFAELLELIVEFASSGPEKQRKLIDFFPPTIHGYVALAVITSATNRQALDIAVRFAHQVMPAYKIDYAIIDAECCVSMSRLVDFGAGNALMSEMMFCALHSFIGLFNRDSPDLRLTLKHDNLVLSELPKLYRNLTIQTGSDENCLIFSEKHLDTVIATRNNATHQAIEQALEDNEVKSRSSQSLSHNVSSLILSMIKHQQSVEIEAICQSLLLSQRTLSRRLSEEGSTFRQLYNNCRCVIAQDLISQNKMSIGQISNQLGFNDEANFSRFFKRQTGLSPTSFRAGPKKEVSLEN